MFWRAVGSLRHFGELLAGSARGFARDEAHRPRLTENSLGAVAQAGGLIESRERFVVLDAIGIQLDRPAIASFRLVTPEGIPGQRFREQEMIGRLIVSALDCLAQELDRAPEVTSSQGVRTFTKIDFGSVGSRGGRRVFRNATARRRAPRGSTAGRLRRLDGGCGATRRTIHAGPRVARLGARGRRNQGRGEGERALTGRGASQL